MFDCISDGKMILYADDSVLILGEKSIDNLVFNANLQLKNVRNYCESNHLFLNIKKTKILQINSDQDLTSRIFLNNKPVDIVDSYKYLGYIIDKKLTFNLQIENLALKMNSGNYFLARVVKFLDKKFLTIIFNSLILSHVIYNKSIILNVTCYLRNKLQSKLHNAESIIDNKLKKYCIFFSFHFFFISLFALFAINQDRSNLST